MKQLSLSGAGSKIPLLGSAAITLLTKHNYKPDIIIGTSSGALLALPLALGLYNEIEKIVKNFTMDTIFNMRPVNKKGKITLGAIWRVLRGKNSLGLQNNLIKTLKNLIPLKFFDDYKYNNKYAEVFIVTVEFKTGKRKYIRAKDLSYENYIKYAIASTTIPIFAESIDINGNYYYDGGIRDFMGSHWGFENLSITENISIYSRPKDFNITETNWKPKNIYTVLQRTIDIMMLEISKNDLIKETLLAEKMNINNIQFFMPHVETSNYYDIDKERQLKWYDIGENLSG